MNPDPERADDLVEYLTSNDPHALALIRQRRILESHRQKVEPSPPPANEDR